MTEQEMKARMKRSRELIYWSREEYQSDQTLKKPQPPLVKAPMTENTMELPKNFGDLPMDKSFLRILHDRRSNRVFTGGSMDLLTLSFLLWAQQGIRGIRGNNYATLRTVPSAGSRHPFECYPLILNVEGLEPGLYHYLPMEHRLEFLKSADIKDEAFADRVVQSVSRQKWVLKSSVIFYYSIVPYRGEWRYAFNAPQGHDDRRRPCDRKPVSGLQRLRSGDLCHCGHGFSGGLRDVRPGRKGRIYFLLCACWDRVRGK